MRYISYSFVGLLDRRQPAKIDKPKIAEIMPFSAGSNYYSHPKLEVNKYGRLY